MLENIYVNHYKCFDEFEASGFGRINLIVGDNNVGKSALLELIRISQNIQNIRMFHNTMIKIFKNRDLSSEDMKLFFQKFNDFKIKNNNDNFEILIKYYQDLKEEDLNKVFRTVDRREEFFLVIKKNKIIEDIEPLEYFLDNERPIYNPLYREVRDNIIFVNTSVPKNNELVKLYSNIQDRGLQQNFLNYLRLFDNSIEFIEPQVRSERDSFLRIKTKYNNVGLISSELGDGINRYIEIIANILKAKDSILLIDEVENGIYYSKQKKFWDTIIQIAEAENVQIFATTHSQEMIQSFVNVCKDKEYKDVSFVSLFRNKENKLKALTIKYEQLEYNINIGHELR